MNKRSLRYYAGKPRVHLPLHYPTRYYHISKTRLERANKFVRSVSALLLLIMLWNFIWVCTNLNLKGLLQSTFSYLFLIGILIVLVFTVTHVINNWNFLLIEPKLFDGSDEPTVAIIIPTYGESVEIVSNTIRSVIYQEWPANKLKVIVSDDGNNVNLMRLVNKISSTTAVDLIYYRPPQNGSKERKGDAKAGNLNAALDYVISAYPEIKFIETRDADDIVANKHFVSYCIEHLTSNPSVSFVQTIKQCRVSRGDPFSNQESLFYQRAMLAKNADNAVFPCGSGLIWRKSDIVRIGGFPAWNLVEDLQSGYEILKAGGKSSFLPFVGAMGQIAPEDIPNFYKQRGTWALDTIRLFYYRNPLFSKGLNYKQKLHFFESEFSYFMSFSMAIFIFTIIVGLNTTLSPVVNLSPLYFVMLCILAAMFEVHGIARARGISYGEQWIARQTWLGLMPIYISAAIRALYYGPNKKPRYRVTKKYHTVGWYWRETFIQSSIVVVLLGSIINNLIRHKGLILINVTLLFWALYFIYGLSQVIINSWHNYPFKFHINQYVSNLIKYRKVN